MTIRTWTHEELEMLAQHKVPQGRSLNAARIKACSLGIRFRPNEGAPANTTPVWTPAKPTYTEDELESLKNGVLPEGRSLSGAYNKAFRMVERWRRVVAAYTALIAFLLGVLVGILGYTGYQAYVGDENAVEGVQ